MIDEAEVNPATHLHYLLYYVVRQNIAACSADQRGPCSPEMVAAWFTDFFCFYFYFSNSCFFHNLGRHFTSLCQSIKDPSALLNPKENVWEPLSKSLAGVQPIIYAGTTSTLKRRLESSDRIWENVPEKCFHKGTAYQKKKVVQY